ncbi:siderophore ABC transporter substrate-binding protein [Leucobacter luti]|uniref:siderophore ABC transporter substrate-binding protein n=1 Tax=Leucobacter luti TaxID=340320 RepID=UPI001FB2A1D1|nr:ABC transporter substrate-binding protein [Leucobacter luti]MCW2289744.1 iron complex transport system substrate-binding protein [Leucobacter luti]
MSLRSTRISAAAALAMGAALLLSSCASSAPAEEQAAEQSTSTTITFTDNHGEVEMQSNPKRVVALDNRAFETLSEWDVPLVAAPKGLMGDGLWPVYTDDADVADVGTHREPNLEAVVAAEPDLIIGGYRFSDSYDDLVAQNPNATVIELAARDDKDVFEELKRETTILGQIFGREDDAEALNEELDTAIAGAKDAYNGTDSVMGLITSGGKIEFAAAGTGRSVGPVFPALGLTPAIDRAAEDTSHGDDISVEAIAASNPEWIIVLDRDASFADPEPGSVPADELIAGSEALANVPAVQKDQIIYLDPTFYLTEDIQAYTGLFEQIKAAFAAA